MRFKADIRLAERRLIRQPPNQSTAAPPHGRPVAAPAILAGRLSVVVAPPE
jgi:hypothetical protein